jgi:hypothetical protein
MPLRAAAWGRDGHQIVAGIALWRLRQLGANKALNEIAAILNSTPEVPMLRKPSTFFAAAVWPDDVRGSDEYSFADNLHFVSIPLNKEVDQDKYEKGKHCRKSAKVPQVPEGVCVIGALEHYGKVLANSTSRKARLEALSFIVHFMGDLHQPLHTSEDTTFINFMKKPGDKGGNFRFIFYLADEAFNSDDPESCLESPDVCSESFEKNGEVDISNRKLHAAWDKFMIQTEMKLNPKRAKMQQYVDDLVSTFPQKASDPKYAAIESGDPVEWAEQAHDLAEKNAYKLIGPRIKISPEDSEEREFFLLNNAYRMKNIRIVDNQLIRAGIRLAAYLRAIFPDA